MAREEIVEKLDSFFSHNLPIDNEPHAVYLMVELRKLITHRSDRDRFRLIEFFSDWTVHTSKDRRFEAIIDMASRIKEALEGKTQPSEQDYDSVLDFLRMPELKNEMEMLFTAESMGLKFFEDTNWSAFSKSLTKVLSQQPINNPIPEIREIILWADNEHSDINIDFTNGGSYSVGMSQEMY